MITLNGKPIKEYGLFLLKGHTHPTPSVEHKSLKIPGKAGLWSFGSEVNERFFNLPIGVLQKSPIDTEYNFNEFLSVLFDEFGKPKPIELTFDYDPGKYYTVEVDDVIDPQRIFEYTEFILPFIAHDPYKYSRVLSDEVTWGSEEITFEWDYLLGHEGTSGGVTVNGPTTFNIAVEGLAVQPVFEIEGTANNLKVECGKYSFVLPNFTNAKWEVDFMKYITYKNGLENMIDMDEFFLLPGINEIKITGSNINIEMRIKFRDKFN